MNEIKFSHEYYKMPFEDWIPNTKLTADVLEVLISERKELSKEFIEYDTAFCECVAKEEKKYHKGYYPLPNGKLLILLLVTTNSSGKHLWTTIRRWTPEKERYYKSLRGKEVEIVFKDDVHVSV